MNNPMYEAQLNKHEEDLMDIKGRLHSYDLGLRWCEGQIKKLAGDSYSPCVDFTEDKEAIDREALKEIDSLIAQNNNTEKLYDELKNNYYILKEAYVALDDRYHREKEIWTDKYNELQDSIALKNRRITSLEQGTKTQSDVINHKNSEICNLKSEIEKWKDAYLRSQVDVNNFQCAYTEATEKVKILNENIEHLEKENEHLRELYSCAVEGSKKIIDKLRKENKE